MCMYLWIGRSWALSVCEPGPSSWSESEGLWWVSPQGWWLRPQDRGEGSQQGEHKMEWDPSCMKEEYIIYAYMYFHMYIVYWILWKILWEKVVKDSMCNSMANICFLPQKFNRNMYGGTLQQYKHSDNVTLFHFSMSNYCYACSLFFFFTYFCRHWIALWPASSCWPWCSWTYKTPQQTHPQTFYSSKSAIWEMKFHTIWYLLPSQFLMFHAKNVK